MLESSFKAFVPQVNLLFLDLAITKQGIMAELIESIPGYTVGQMAYDEYMGEKFNTKGMFLVQRDLHLPILT